MKPLKCYSLKDIIQVINPGENRNKYTEGCGFHIQHAFLQHYLYFDQIKEWIKNKTRPLAWGATLGSAIIIMKTPKTIKAYSIDYRGFPNIRNDRIYEWSRIPLNKALEFIKTKPWTKSYVSDVEYVEANPRKNWKRLGMIILRVISKEYSYNNEDPPKYVEEEVEKFIPFYIFRIKSGKLRIESLVKDKVPIILFYLMMKKIKENPPSETNPFNMGTLRELNKEADYPIDRIRKRDSDLFCEIFSSTLSLIQYETQDVNEDTWLAIQTEAAKEKLLYSLKAKKDNEVTGIMNKPYPIHRNLIKATHNVNKLLRHTTNIGFQTDWIESKLIMVDGQKKRTKFI